MSPAEATRQEPAPIKSRILKSKTIYKQHESNELFFAVVGHVGSGNSTIISTLQNQLDTLGYEVHVLKAKDEILLWADEQGKSPAQTKNNSLSSVETLQALGDEMRSGDHAAIAVRLIQKVRTIRAERTGLRLEDPVPVVPDGKRRAYLFDSVRHPAEVELLRRVYENAFTLLGVVCIEDVRFQRIVKKYDDAGQANAQAFMKRDAKTSTKEGNGQRVADAFHLADYFIDNSSARYNDVERRNPNPDWDIPEQLSRLLKIITHAEIVRPTLAETSMHAAYGAQSRSACLSRQVGACLVDARGNIVSTGTNEVPRAGGGVYMQGFSDLEHSTSDGRCAYSGGEKYCANTKEQNAIIDELIKDIDELKDSTNRFDLPERLRNTRIGGLLEFSRAVHAEMEALMAAARTGVSTVGTRMFVTTFPCHYCARHLISAGIDEVQYIEPYPKSQALNLHRDAITCDPIRWEPPSRDRSGKSKVLFKPFTGVSPRMYIRAFQKERELKDHTGRLNLFPTPWGDRWRIGKASYAQLEADLSCKKDPL